MIILKKFLPVFIFFFSSTFIIAAQDEGLASFYGDAFHGSKTANGEVYDRNQLTGAHKTLPFGTYVKVTRADNGKSVVVKINDRGPFISGRIIDVSKKAAERLGLIEDRVAQVTLEKVNAPRKSSVKSTPAVVSEEIEVSKPTPKPEVPAKTPAVTPKKAVKKKVEKANTAPTKIKEESKKKKSGIESPKVKLVTDKNYQNYDLYKIQVLRPAKEGFGIQVASLSEYENVLKRIAELQGKYFKNILTSVEKGKDGKPVYKVILGPFPDQSKASAYKKSLAKKHKISGFLVNLGEIQY